jgi:crotonobetainyl-CoA:carnitine CoA-transferase CaiB-like acyl-CoA transferase
VLSGVTVAECATGIAGPYCGKLFADAGGDVVKVEPLGGDPLRRWVASGHAPADGPGSEDGPLFRFLNQSKRSVLDGDEGDRLVAAADIVLVDGPPRHPRPAGQVVVSISPFGLAGPWADRPSTEFTLQAWCGSTGNRGMPEDPPLAAGGRLGEYIGGAYAAVAALAALRTARATGAGEHVDLAMLDCMCLTMNTYTTLFAQFLGWRPMPPGPARTIETPSIEPTADGYVGFCTITAQQFQDFLVLIERPDLLDDHELSSAMGRSKRLHEVLDIIQTWTTKHTTSECIELASLMRIPVAPVGNGPSVLEMNHVAERGPFVPSADGAFRQPRVPYRIEGVASRPFAPAPRLGEHAGHLGWEPQSPLASEGPPELPLAGVRVIDFTAFWAGPAASMMLATLGADVVKIESAQRPDGMRFATTSSPKVPQWWEYGPAYHGANVNKRAVTLDMTRPEGLDLAKRLIGGADAVIENFSPRVMENFGLTWEEVHRVNPRAIMVRMPAFGLDGPWRDRTGFAQTMEQISGMAWVTGRRDGPPIIPRGACDPLAGMHAVFALMVALEQRQRDAKGRLVEVTLVEAALNAAAEQVIEWTAFGELLSRDTNRGPFARPQGVYPCAGEEQWLALAVATDEQWDACCRVMGLDPAVRADHDAADAAVDAWCAMSDVETAVDELLTAGVPAAVVVVARDIAFNPQLAARRFFEPVEHPVLGRIEVPSLPFRFASRVASGEPWLRRAAPVLGQHNDEILAGELRLEIDEMAELRANGIIGETMVSR